MMDQGHKIDFFTDGISLTDLPVFLSELLESEGLFRLNRTTNIKKVEFCGFIPYNKKVYFFLPKTCEHAHFKSIAFCKLIFRSIIKYSKTIDTTQVGDLLRTSPEELSQLNRIDDLSWLMRDWSANGQYIRKDSINRKKTSGNILWSRTLKMRDGVVFSEGIPLFTKFITRRFLNNSNLVSFIHSFFVNEAFSSLGWLYSDRASKSKTDLFIKNLPCSRDEASYAINKELRLQYISRNINLLKCLRRLLLNSTDSWDRPSPFGVKHFWPVWEAFCKNGFGDQVDIFMAKMPTPRYCDSTGQVLNAGRKLTPDIVIQENGKTAILDAKYYDARTTFPGWESLSKQILYKKFIDKAMTLDKAGAANCFVFPKPHDHHALPTMVILKTGESEDFADSPIECMFVDLESLAKSYLEGRIDSELRLEALKLASKE